MPYFKTLLLSTLFFLGCKSQIDVEIFGKRKNQGVVEESLISIEGLENQVIHDGGSYNFTINYTGMENITLDASDISLVATGDANCTNMNVSGVGSTTRSVLLSDCTGNGTVGITIAQGTAVSSTGELAPSSSNSPTFTVDNIAPLVAIGTASSSFTSLTNPTTFELTYEEIPSGLTETHITIGGDDAGCTAVVSDNATLTPDVTVSGCSVAAGTITISVAGGRSADSLGNPDGGAGPSDSVSIQNIPTVTFSSISANAINSTDTVDFNLSLDFAPNPVLDSSNVTFNGISTDCTVSNVAGGGTTSPVVTVTGCSGTGNMSINVYGQGPSQEVFVTQSKPMIFVVRTTGPNETFSLPFRDTFVYDSYVQWGDNSFDRITVFNQVEGTHNYSTPGDYTIKIYGTAEAWYFNSGGDKDKMISVNQLGELGWTNFENAFHGCNNLATFTAGATDTSSVTNMKSMFSETSGLTSIDLSNFNTSAVTNMTYMFKGASGLSNLDLSSFNIISVKLMYGMFRDTSGLTSLNLSTFNTSDVIDMSFMFYGATGLTNLDLSSFNTSSVQNMGHMFQNVSELTSLDLSSFNTSTVSDMAYMFNGASSLTDINLSSFNTSAVEDMGGMFGGTAALTGLDLSSFNTSAVKNMTWMFRVNPLFLGIILSKSPA